MESSEDKRLLSLLRQDDSNAFEKLFIKYHKKVYAFSLKLLPDSLDAEELVQNVFLSIWDQRKKIKISSTFLAYLFGITRHMVYDIIKQKIRFNAFVEYSIHKNHDFAFITDDDVHFRELEEKLTKLIDELPERRKEIFLLSRFSGLSYKEISKKLDISENTVDSQIRNALDFLRKQLLHYKNPG